MSTIKKLPTDGAAAVAWLDGRHNGIRKGLEDARIAAMGAVSRLSVAAERVDDVARFRAFEEACGEIGRVIRLLEEQAAAAEEREMAGFQS